jgi:hypothetical protein
MLCVEQMQHRPSGIRKGASSTSLCDEGLPSTRAPSPRQLPTDHDYDGGLHARSANIRVINRREQLLDLCFICPTNPKVGSINET